MDKAVDVSAYFYGVKEDVSTDYRDLALFLGIADTRNIESRNPDATSCCMDVLQTWKRAKGDQATVEVLLQALVSAKLESAADNLRMNLGKEDYPKPPPDQINITLFETPENETPENETRENAGKENGSFSCRIWKWLDISCICCSYKVWVCLLYAICLILRTCEVSILTVAGVILYICKSNRGPTYKSSGVWSRMDLLLYAICLILIPYEVTILTLAGVILHICKSNRGPTYKSSGVWSRDDLRVCITGAVVWLTANLYGVDFILYIIIALVICDCMRTSGFSIPGLRNKSRGVRVVHTSSPIQEQCIPDGFGSWQLRSRRPRESVPRERKAADGK